MAQVNNIYFDGGLFTGTPVNLPQNVEKLVRVLLTGSTSGLSTNRSINQIIGTSQQSPAGGYISQLVTTNQSSVTEAEAQTLLNTALTVGLDELFTTYNTLLSSTLIDGLKSLVLDQSKTAQQRLASLIVANTLYIYVLVRRQNVLIEQTSNTVPGTTATTFRSITPSRNVPAPPVIPPSEPEEPEGPGEPAPGPFDCAEVDSIDDFSASASWYQFNDIVGQIAPDSSANGLDLILGISDQNSTGNPSNGGDNLEFDGGNDQLTVPSGLNEVLGDTCTVFMAQFYSGGGLETYFNNRVDDDNLVSLGFENESPSVYAVEGGNTYIVSTDDTVVSSGHTVAWVLDYSSGFDVSMYVNGQIAPSTVTSSAGTPDGLSGATGVIAAGITAAGGLGTVNLGNYEGFNYYLVIVPGSALDATQIACLHNLVVGELSTRGTITAAPIPDVENPGTYSNPGGGGLPGGGGEDVP